MEKTDKINLQEISKVVVGKSEEEKSSLGPSSKRRKVRDTADENSSSVSKEANQAFTDTRSKGIQGCSTEENSVSFVNLMPMYENMRPSVQEDPLSGSFELFANCAYSERTDINGCHLQGKMIDFNLPLDHGPMFERGNIDPQGPLNILRCSADN